MTPREQDSDSPTSLTTSLPTRLSGWRMYQDTFAYGGDEVDLSVFDTERAFQNTVDDLTAAAKKRKRSDALLPGEVWRAKNVILTLHSYRGLGLIVVSRCLMIASDYGSPSESPL